MATAPVRFSFFSSSASYFMLTLSVGLLLVHVTIAQQPTIPKYWPSNLIYTNVSLLNRSEISKSAFISVGGFVSFVFSFWIDSTTPYFKFPAIVELVQIKAGDPSSLIVRTTKAVTQGTLLGHLTGIKFLAHMPCLFVCLFELDLHFLDVGAILISTASTTMSAGPLRRLVLKENDTTVWIDCSTVGNEFRFLQTP